MDMPKHADPGEPAGRPSWKDRDDPGSTSGLPLADFAFPLDPLLQGPDEFACRGSRGTSVDRAVPLWRQGTHGKGALPLGVPLKGDFIKVRPDL